MKLQVNSNDLIVQDKYKKLPQIVGNNPISIFSFDNIKELKELFIVFIVAGSIAAVGIIGLSIIGRKYLEY